MHKIIGGFNKQFPNNFDAEGVLKGNLSRWAEDGVLMLNTALTVRKGEAGSHLKHWMPFTKEVIEQLNKRPEKGLKPVVYMLWGKQAIQYKQLVDTECPVIEAEHPAASLYAGNRDWHHNNCFLSVNDALKTIGADEVSW